MKGGALLAFLGLWLFFGVAGAVEVTILPGNTESFELRSIPIPGGETTTLYVITGSPVRLRVDGDLIIAERIEFDVTNRLMRIIGAGSVSYDDVSTKGRNYLLDLKSSELNFKDVFIFTKPLDVKGLQATRQPGQIDITGAAFSPCSRCQQDVQDYRFTAERMNLYPGDRLVAFNVTVYIRDLPSFFLPLMVVPLGPPDRQPRFEITRGSETQQAEVALDWPYVFGPNALGTVSLRYYADVAPNQSSSWTENVLGGTVQENYLGGGFEHRFYTARGQGNLDFFYTPSFEDRFDPTIKTLDQVDLSFGYETEEELDGLRPQILIERDDASNQRILNLTASLEQGYSDFDFRAVTQTYFDLDAGDANQTPSYSEGEGALRTYGQVSAEQSGDLTLSVGPFSLTGLRLELGAYEDYANASNPSATSSPISINNTPVIRSGRLVGGQTLTLEAFSPFSGASIAGSTSFLGSYYTTTNDDSDLERLIDWDTALGFDQTFEGGTLGLDYSRTLTQGETPFAFDAQTPSTLTNLDSSLTYTPYDWLELSVDETYTFENSREPQDVGAGPIETRLGFFNNLDWIDATLEQRFDVQEGDPGLLGASVTLTTPDAALGGSLTLRGIYDLSHLPPQDDALPDLVPINESQYDILAEASYGLYGGLDVAFGFDYNADPDALDTYYSSSYAESVFNVDTSGSVAVGESLYKPLEVGLTLGSISEGDGVPGLRAAARRDINDGTMQSLVFEAEAQAGPLEFSADQTFDFVNLDASDSEFTVTYPDIVELSGVGFWLLPPSLFGLEPDPSDPVSYSLSLSDLTFQDTEKLYELTYETTYGPFSTYDGLAGLGFSNTALTAQLNVPFGYLGTGLGPLGFGVKFGSALAIADDAIPQTYLSSADMTLTTDFFSRFALQGALAYDATPDGLGGLGSQSLGFTNFGATVRLWDDLYFSAVLDDTWEFINPTLSGPSATTPYNFQPIFYLTLDRCCWAFYVAYNTANGSLTLTLGYPGSEQGATGAFNTGLYLPRREFE